MPIPTRRRSALAALIGGVVLAGSASFALMAPAGAQTSTTAAPTTVTTEAPTTTAAPTTTEAPTTTAAPATTTSTRAPRTTTTKAPKERSGGGTAGSGGSTTRSTTATRSKTAAAGSSSDGSGSDSVEGADTAPTGGTPFFTTGRKVWTVVGLLIALAIGLSVLTVLYWRRTRPGGPPADEVDELPDGGDAVGPTTQSAPVGPLDASLAQALRPEGSESLKSS